MEKQAFNKGKLDRKATLNAYVTAKHTGQWQLANRIRFANSRYESEQDLTKEFDFIDKLQQFPLILMVRY